MPDNPSGSPFPEPPSDEEIAARLRRALGEDEPVPLDEKLEEIDEKIRLAASTKMPDPPEWNYTPKPKPDLRKTSNYAGAGLGIGIAYMLIGAPLFGVAVGWFIDQRFGLGNTGQTFGVMIGAGLGFWIALVRLNEANKRDDP